MRHNGAARQPLTGTLSFLNIPQPLENPLTEEVSTAPAKPSPRRVAFNLPRQPLFWAVSVGHMTNDIFMSMGPVLLVFLGTAILPMSVAQIGLAVGARDILGSVSQPLFGWLSDRTGGRWLGAGGVAWVVAWLMVSMALALTGRFWLMVVPFALSSLGSGAFHPVGSMYATETDPARRASNTAYFFLFGQTGLAIGPALAGLLLASASAPRIMVGGVSNPLTPVFLLSAIAIPGVLSMIATIPHRRGPAAMDVSLATTEDAPGSPGAGLARVAVGSLLVMGTVVVLRSMVHSSSSNFVPALFQNKGWDPAQYGLITSAYWISSALAGVVFGQLADRYGIRAIIVASLLLAAPPLFFLPLSDGLWAVILTFLTGGLVGGTFSIFVVLAQQMIPAGKGFASGAILGFTFVSAALGSLLAGLLAGGTASLFGRTTGAGGGIGLEATYQVMAALMLLAGLLALALPRWMYTATSAPETP
jgi:FSR family fosmidomycin resistance protein-like MFS transporter